MAGMAAKKRKRYTWDDYLTFPDDKRIEIINGELFDMSPAPHPDHQRVLSELFLALKPHFRGTPCELFLSPVDVKLADDTVVQPDLFVVCPPTRVDKAVEGPPSLAIEILSPGTLMHDRVRKMLRYAAAGVKEYWIVSVEARSVEVYSLRGDSYEPVGAFIADDIVSGREFPKVKIPVVDVFAGLTSASPRVVKESRDRYQTRRK